MSQITTIIAHSEPPVAEYLSKYGFMRQHYLQNHRPEFYAELINDGELNTHLLRGTAYS